MAFPTAQGVPDLATAGYIPIQYATRLLAYLYITVIFASICNTDYEGMLQNYGDTVRVRKLPDGIDQEYQKGVDLQYQDIEPDYIDFVIERGRYWAFNARLVDQRQSDINFVDAWSDHFSKKLKISIDRIVLANIYSQVHASNTGATAGADSGSVNLGAAAAPVVLTEANIIPFIVDCGLVLDEQEVPDDERWMVLPSWACALIKNSEIKDASMTGDGKSVLRSGRIGMIDRFDLYRSNQVAKATDTGNLCYNPVFGHKMSTTFAMQISESEKLPNPKDFGQLARALMVYDFKVMKPEAIGHGYITRG